MKNICKLLVLMVLCISILVNSVLAVNIQTKGDPNDYTDISGHWAESSIKFVIEKGYFKGMTKKEFMPDVNLKILMNELA